MRCGLPTTPGQMKSNQAKSDDFKKLNILSIVSGSDLSLSSSRGRSIKQYRQLVLGIAVQQDKQSQSLF